MHVMAKRKKPNRNGVSLGMYLDRALAEAFERYLDSVQPPTTKVGVVEMLLTKFLTEKGFWPPPGRPPGSK